MDDHSGFRVTTKDVYTSLEEFKTEVRGDLIGLKQDIAGLKVKSGVWGILGALIVVVPAVLGLFVALS